MRHQHHSSDSTLRLVNRIVGAIVGATLLSLLLVSAASAFEQVGTFGSSGEGQLLTSAKGAAVNITGAGGVAPGTVYTDSSINNRVLVYGPRGEFESSWGYGQKRFPAKYERCGPAGEPGSECTPHLANVQGEGAGEITAPVGIAVDQQTGDVYLLNGRTIAREHHLISVFTAGGQPIGEGFGDRSAFGSSFAESPEALHEAPENGIAVDDSGTVYISDNNAAGASSQTEESRLMTFKQQVPGDDESYAYSGSKTLPVASLALDQVGDLYFMGEDKVTEYPPGATGAPICEYKIVSSGGAGSTVDPKSGDVFYFDYKSRRGHQLACNSEGKFTEVGQFEVLPKTAGVRGLAFNPDLSWDSTRPPGVLYAVDGEEPGLGHIYAPPAAIAPVVEAESVTSVASSSAVLHAQVNPKGSSTRYVFQYIGSAAYAENGSDPFAGAVEAPLGGGLVAAGQNGVSVVASLTGLQPEAEYHYRVIAISHCNLSDESEICEDVGADQVLKTFPALIAPLPDGRAYELISPAEKHGGEVVPLSPGHGTCAHPLECKPGPGSLPYPRQFSLDGDALTYEAFSFSPTEGAATFNQYISRRAGSAWQTENISPSQLGGNPSGYEAFSPNLEEGLIYQAAPSLTGSAPLEYQNIYKQSAAAPSALTPLVVEAPPNRSPRGGASPFDVVYAGASADRSHVFFQANDALTAATPSAPAAVDGGANKMNLYEWSGGQLRLVNVAPGNAATAAGASFGSGSSVTNAISTDGSRVFWTASSGHLYVRTDAASTEEIPDPGKFLAASTDGSAVLLSDGHIYDLESAASTDLTEGAGGFLGIAGQSDDLSHVYFVDKAVLPGAGPNDQGAEAQAGQGNLYVRYEGVTSFVATLSFSSEGSVDGADWASAAADRTAQASPNGNWLAFLSINPLTHQDEGHCGKEGFDCLEVFLYDAVAKKLICASCSPSGAAPLGRSFLPVFENAPIALGQPRYLIDSGRLFFDSRDSLTPLDTNGGVEDVYEYEPSGVGSCELDGGCRSLISAGSGTSDSNFLAMDPSGKNVAFTTRDKLLPSDKDELVDVYDAREGGGFAAGSEAGECSGEACQHASPPQPEAVPGSLAFSGPGNLLAPAPVGTVVKPKPLTRAQQLAKALTVCKKKPKRKRSACEKAAKKKYGKKAKKAISNSSGGKS